MKHKLQKQKLSVWEKRAYGAGDMGSNLFWGLIPFTAIFYTDYFGISAIATGAMILLARIPAAFLAIPIGIFADRTKTKYGHFRPWILYGALPLALFAFLAHLTPGFTDTEKLVYAYTTYFLFLLMYLVVNVPYEAFLGVISADPNERTNLSAYKMIFAQLGLLLVGVFVLPAAEQSSFSNGVLYAAILGFILLIVCFFFTRERVKPVKEENNKLSEDLRDLIKNKPCIMLFIAGFMLTCFYMIHDLMIPYYAKYYVVNQLEISGQVFGFDVSWQRFTIVLIVIDALITIAAIMIVKTWLVSRFEKKNIWIACFVFASIFSALFYFIPGDNLSMVMLFQALFTLSIGSAGFLMFSMYADVVDNSEVNTERRATGLIYSSATMSHNLGAAFALGIPLLLLGVAGYEANQNMDEDMQQQLRLIFALLPILFAIIAIIALKFYNLDDDTIKKNAETLSEVKETNTNAASAIREKMNEQGVTIEQLAQQVNCDRSKLNKLLRNGNFDPVLLLKISMALETDFFAYYSDGLRHIAEKQDDTI